MKLLKQWGLLALGVLIAANTSAGIDYGGNWHTLLVVVLMMSVFNLFLRPLLLIMALPLVIMTMGVGLLFINAFLFWLIGQLVDGFTVASIWSAIWGAFIVGLTHLVAGLLLGSGNGNVSIKVQRGRKQENRRLDDDDVIDV